ncbi:hypothetical protein Psed_3821 [Pseudonocardia dioxanivorans CB1190]|uniref:Uncharacterized protein n=1 Tax=Pseudonocardia dioxanivorans (strain ATCC 55486 / DSM 44775 / JCM 13855 / CB1190) TaxID=675635 RepID=F4CLE9_PSEUX|nr:hypothetical protein [Pseudonocardia dioxanivorans]AEA25991.1 hypothetical protein Psed_3821 [Pseudonocardia dioxanivorans CB1190]
MTDPSPDRPAPRAVPLPGDPRPGPPPSAPAGARPVEAVRASVERAVAGLDAVAGRPVAEHVAAFEAVHAALGEALAAGGPSGDQPDGR